MNRTSASVFLALLLDVIFTLFFFFFLSQWKSDEEAITLHMNQVGIFKNSENAKNCIQQVESLGLEGFSYEKGDLFIVVTSLSLDQNLCLEQQKILNENQLSFILKEVTSSDRTFIKAVQNQDFNQVMELMRN